MTKDMELSFRSERNLELERESGDLANILLKSLWRSLRERPRKKRSLRERSRKKQNGVGKPGTNGRRGRKTARMREKRWRAAIDEK